MTDPIDIYRAAQIQINKHGAEAEEIALAKMRAFMDDEDLPAASA